MNPFASRTVTTLEIPFDPPHTVTIRRLAGRHLGKAQEASQFETVDSLKRMGGPTFQKELAQLGNEEERAKQVEKFKADPLNSYDKYVLCMKGIVAWTYEESLTPVAVTETDSAGGVATRMVVPAIEDLTDDAVEFFAREILRLSKPALFQTVDEAAAARGEGSGGSIVP